MSSIVSASSRKRFRGLRLETLEQRLPLAVTLLNDFAGMAFDPDVPIPVPDTQVAVGPRHVVEVINNDIAFYNKQNGHRLFEASATEFFAPIGAGPDVPLIARQIPRMLLDPQIGYDEDAGRFIATHLEIDFETQMSHLLLAVSDDSDPRGAWEMHRINIEDRERYWGDYDQLGWDADGIYVSLNMFSWPNTPDLFGNGSNFHHVSLVTIAKASVLDGDASTLTYYDVELIGPHFSMQPALMRGATPGTPMYFVEEAGPGRIQVVEMTNKLSDIPVFNDYTISVPRHKQAPAASQPLGYPIDSGGGRMLHAAWRDGRLVTTHVVGVGMNQLVARSRWYEIDTTLDQPQLVQMGELNSGPGVHSYYPSIDIAANGDIGMTFMQSSEDEFMSMYVTGRSELDPPGTMQTPILVREGDAALRLFVPIGEVGGVQRAGDYSGIQIDPEDDTFWAANEFATSLLPVDLPIRNNWGTWIANFSISRASFLTDESTGFVSLSPRPLTTPEFRSERNTLDQPELESSMQDVVPKELAWTSTRAGSSAKPVLQASESAHRSEDDMAAWYLALEDLLLELGFRHG